ncbi:MAG: M48 family metalloprotease [Candidatus Odinarchaeum yellowstonii]|uniref:Protease HtpX homolog n=1 Tax=Odinarchaeota yellowstonii (strain LCB_4) TaxID=1841599 RepID=A0AAF0IB60_ODILC|nr:MAG: M48 family metalloprotease [Candidatus Odinarchaeum yellowstonii]
MNLSQLKIKMGQSLALIIVLELIFVFGIVYAIDFFFDALYWIPVFNTGLYLPIPRDIIWGFISVIIFLTVQWMLGSPSVEYAMHPRPLRKGENPWIESTVEELSVKAGVKPPKIKIVDMQAPNAFVYGRTVGGASLCLTTGLLKSLNKNEIKAVIGHEIGHLKHRDVIIMTLASGVPLLALLVLRGGLYTAYGIGRTSRSSSRSDGTALMVVILIIVAIASAIFFLSLLAVRGLSRLREHYADVHSAISTGDPHSMQSALAKITWGLSIAPPSNRGEAMRNLYIADASQAKLEVAYVREHKEEFDLDKDGVLDEQELLIAMEKEAKKTRLSGLSAKFATHPPTYKRILLLKKIEKDLASLPADKIDIKKLI